MGNFAELQNMLRNSPLRERLIMLLSQDMDRHAAPLLIPTSGLLRQNHHQAETSNPLGSPEATALSKEPGLEKNSTASQYELMPGEIIIASLLWGVLWLSSVFGNSLVCLVIYRSRRTQSTTNYFVVSMACADLLISVGCTPFVLFQLASNRWTFGSMMCKTIRYFQYLTPGVQIYVLLSICVDRFYTIVYPLSFKVTREKAKKMIAASWIFNAALMSPAFIWGGLGRDNHCRFFPPYSWDGAVYSIIHVLVAFLIPSVLIILFYQKVIKHIWRIGSEGRTVRRTMNVVPRTKVKTIKMFLILNALFLLSWLPFYVVQLWHPLETDLRKSALVFLTVTWISFSSSALKPTLYSAYNANFRRGIKETFCMSSMKCYRSNAYTITTSSKMAKKNYVGISEVPAGSKTVSKDTIYDSFNREAKEKKLAWPINSNPPNTFV
ncbi:probable G-protein coupled receptor 19 [Python bivittatus]|uniref:Probable G-protein coupled receptor 19 n=1 Tax=Python bivittatus TaxID=176946 RepID=A0A9F5IUG7_PYTBI|nr:probable G-protein coupled receptor 19 [Python bivittatus]XP_025020999.1 probable G-protein coupled receptor 19 [Python bivittatus]